MDGFKNIKIKNFRGIDHLTIDEFSCVNVFLEQNSCVNDKRMQTATTRTLNIGIWMRNIWRR